MNMGIESSETGVRVIARCPRIGCGAPVENGRCTNPKCGYALPEARKLEDGRSQMADRAKPAPVTCWPPSGRAGSTLAELLVVVAIISILVALTAGASLRAFRAKQTQLRQLGFGYNHRLEFFARDPNATGELTDPRLRQIYQRQELAWLGGAQ